MALYLATHTGAAMQTAAFVVGLLIVVAALVGFVRSLWPPPDAVASGRGQ